MSAKTIPSLRAGAELSKLGNDIAIARKRRRFTQQRLAEGAGAHVATIRRLEKGDPGVSLGVLAMVLMTLGESDRIANLLDIAKDDVGLVLSVNDLPQRIRPKRQRKAVAGSQDASERHSDRSEPEAF
ncbi:XRE family transcriptional regulator [Verminephrobacter aporrectodeae subsp. tuberculatae]|uniref:XRE family transcriptional regulator n=1 Tax=Verminephrobacter aporrectodeae subsp. tuberculatae TaxID=1110392 RepID=A0ABT3KXD9_9BURK|nr:helix-turn-helix domain-containing protein [Verminephrobacter aporrectodeae]MCW5257869.1 XRE family transcriptional regulator [Verminephrobacter aporrectodeae subsp. tuberculatae]MCW5323001.1 XRE family transcriptional regulator [Verminephrobacter aporrectodeae subsp. tuberculatae]MCW8199216.1 XRE family transcriptional regulator [Verminephrobacter aporrectodeae subsp. tuberculatae]MCW8208218.1 XRE family transcriptional regulator [Verminephrobacter aporrectodeae subsp. tuberculatae]